MAEKVFRVIPSFFGSGWIAAVFKYDFLQSNLSRILRLKASADQFPRARGEAFRIRDSGRLAMRRAIVNLELSRSQPVVSALGFLIG
jgi:hypothetical protein